MASGHVCCFDDFEIDDDIESVRCLRRGCRTLLLRGRGESLDDFRRRIARHRATHRRRLWPALAIASALLAPAPSAGQDASSTTLWYTVPNRPAPDPGRCDSLHIVCDSLTAECDTMVVAWDEEVSWVEIWWAPRWGTFSKIREKYVRGLEGQRDSVQVPSDTAATVYLVARDSTGNRACPSRTRTVGIPPVSVPPPPSVTWRRPAWFDVEGRRLPAHHELVLEAALSRAQRGPLAYSGVPSGVYFRRLITPTGVAFRRVVVLH